MADWQGQCYDDGKTRNLWRQWYDDTPACQGSHDSTFRIIEQLTMWRGPHARKLSNGVIEIKLTGGVEWRIFGLYGKAQQVFIVVAIGYHKGKVYTPKGILKTAKKRMKEVESNPGKAVSCERPQ
jgi:Phage derived protein Gp49-like (DUF891)